MSRGKGRLAGDWIYCKVYDNGLVSRKDFSISISAHVSQTASTYQLPAQFPVSSSTTLGSQVSQTLPLV